MIFSFNIQKNVQRLVGKTFRILGSRLWTLDLCFQNCVITDESTKNTKKYSSCKKKDRITLKHCKTDDLNAVSRSTTTVGISLKRHNSPRKDFRSSATQTETLSSSILLLLIFHERSSSKIMQLCSSTFTVWSGGKTAKRSNSLFSDETFSQEPRVSPPRPSFLFFSAVLSSTSGIKQDVKKSDPGIKRCQDLWSRSISDLRKQPEWALNGGHTPLTT